jgi:hypothetical protein
MSNKIIVDNNLVQVDSLSFGDSYGWTEIEVFFSKELNRFFWVEGSGCSCNSLWDDIRSLADMCDGSRQSAANAVRSLAEANKKEYYGDIATAANKVLGFK